VGAYSRTRLDPIESERGFARERKGREIYSEYREGGGPRIHMSDDDDDDEDDSSLFKIDAVPKGRGQRAGFRARRLFLFITPFSAGRPRLNHCASPYRTRVLGDACFTAAAVRRCSPCSSSSSLTTGNKVSNIPFDRAPSRGRCPRGKSGKTLSLWL